VAQQIAVSRAKLTDKQLAEMREQVATGRSLQHDLDRFGQLLTQQDTGGIFSTPGVGKAAQSIVGMWDPTVKEMESISNKVAPLSRPIGSGSTSDFDAKMFLSATVGLDKPKETNKNIIQALKAKNQSDQDRLSFMENYSMANNGDLTGADAAWSQYLDANPIFDPSSPDKPVLNPKRMGYKEYFQSGGKQPAGKANDPLGILK
ncbi:MAG: hypothetical protein H7829_17200, partial [Magnetococcus sp. THC-1_WYH]